MAELPVLYRAVLALSEFRPGSGCYLHDWHDRELVARKVLEAVNYQELERLTARLWKEREILRRRLEGDE